MPHAYLTQVAPPSTVRRISPDVPTAQAVIPSAAQIPMRNAELPLGIHGPRLEKDHDPAQDGVGPAGGVAFELEAGNRGPASLDAV